MGLYRKGSSWYIDYYFQGRRKREKIDPNRKLAESVLAKRRTQIAEKRFLDVLERPKIKFGELASAYLDYAKTNKLSWKRDRLSINNLSRFVGDKFVFEIAPESIEEYKSKRRLEVSPATVNRKLACLKHIFSKAIQWDMADSNPVKKVRLLKENNERLRYLTNEEIHGLLENCAAHLRPIVICALFTGMRKGEILKLKWEDVDLEQKIIFVRNSKHSMTGEIPLSDHLADAMRNLKFKSPYVFCNEDGKPFVDIKNGFDGAVRRAGIKDFHDLRHTFASHLVMAGVDLIAVKELPGHKTINITLRYAHLSPMHKRQAIQSLKYFDGHYLDTRRVVEKVIPHVTDCDASFGGLVLTGKAADLKSAG